MLRRMQGAVLHLHLHVAPITGTCEGVLSKQGLKPDLMV
jgi:hypothetical protein